MPSSLTLSADGSVLIEEHKSIVRVFSTRTYELLDEYCPRCYSEPHNIKKCGGNS